ncbi:hypothetical protein [Streptomyces glaucus]|uniref:MarR family transcriptional regulator n=1 Tax=Streptomyces glaucus TaxID=284029 RepID=A0ABP5WY16_9ACTN
MSRRIVVTALLPEPDPEPTYPEYEEIQAEARRKSHGPISQQAIQNMQEVVQRRGGDWCTAVLGRPFRGLRSTGTREGWMLILADERGLTPELPARVLEDRKRARDAQELREKRTRERFEREMRRWEAALAAAGVEMTVRENTRHAGVGGSLRHAVPKEDLVSGRSRKHLADRGLCETPGRTNPLHLSEPVNAPANCRRCLAYMEKVRTLNAPAPPTAAERKLLGLVNSGAVVTFHVRRCVTIRDTSQRSNAAWGHLGRKVDVAVRKLEKKGWVVQDQEHSATQTAGSGHRWRLTEAGIAALEG